MTRLVDCLLAKLTCSPPLSTRHNGLPPSLPRPAPPKHVKHAVQQSSFSQGAH
ncbi:uncharacterized protein SETTUDRAFT_167002 [Exserohilum turcica Et28A]|uniref:Uncharacterized protein n=1 Tax=Exserohilum turcicum (strain 28A) TaxID=671987 RepID=R0IZT1_EXST2|nr:uncharacterized protein SETTUDRAFT_167002 [Exserohilum turcica Et28A]EOA90041.1 hypothetical protein SETTUDRAFT_167002 [Exserohilum turcica Et28A]